MKKILFFALTSIFFTPILTFAQVSNFNSEISIETYPAHPEANTETTVSLNAYTVDTTGATINWFIDGIEKPEARNDYNFDLTTKNIGEETKVRVEVTLFDGRSFTKTINIKPVRLDMVVEADTSAPAFYKGRPLPSVGSQVRVIATPHTGETIKPRELTYLWKQDNKVLFGGPVRGKQVAEIEVGMGREQIITVNILDNNNQTIAGKSLVLPVSEPELLFYEENPLKGASQMAISDNYFMVSDSVTFRAEPYFMNKDIFTSNPLIEWEVGGRKVQNTETDPQYLTLEKTSESGKTKIDFHIRNLEQLLQGIKSGFTVNF